MRAFPPTITLKIHLVWRLKSSEPEGTVFSYSASGRCVFVPLSVDDIGFKVLRILSRTRSRTRTNLVDKG